MKKIRVMAMALSACALLLTGCHGAKANKAFEIPDKSEMWANDEKNRSVMMSLFGLDFPAPEQKTQNEEEADGDNLPFGEGE